MSTAASPLQTLADNHYRMLREGSGISDVVLQGRGYSTLTSASELANLGYSKTQQKLSPALAVPFWNVHGKAAFVQIRPDSPRPDEKGKPRKYETPYGTRLKLDVHRL